jgi:MORN repeat protein
VSRRALLVTLAVAGVSLVLLLPPRARPIGACPDGARLAGAPPPHGTQQWCERLGPDRHTVKEGPYVAWHTNGRRKTEGRYRNGLMDGHWTFWYPNGRRREEGEFQGGREEGLWSRWYADGQVEDRGEYRDGVRQGPWTFWHENGHKEREGAYADGVEVGPWARWNVKGEPCTTQTQLGASPPQRDRDERVSPDNA